MFRRFRRMLEDRRYRDAEYARPNLRRRTEATSLERIVRSLRRRESFGYDEAEARAGDNVRLVFLLLLLAFAVWFVVRSLMALNIFAG